MLGGIYHVYKQAAISSMRPHKARQKDRTSLPHLDIILKLHTWLSACTHIYVHVKDTGKQEHMQTPLTGAVSNMGSFHLASVGSFHHGQCGQFPPWPVWAVSTMASVGSFHHG